MSTTADKPAAKEETYQLEMSRQNYSNEKYYVTICVHTGRRLMSRDQPPTETFDTFEEAQRYFERYKAGYIASTPNERKFGVSVPYWVRGIEWATIRQNGKVLWREEGLPANL
jgi:hypothetical protein